MEQVECKCYKPWISGCNPDCVICETEDEWEYVDSRCAWNKYIDKRERRERPDRLENYCFFCGMNIVDSPELVVTMASEEGDAISYHISCGTAAVEAKLQLAKNSEDLIP